RGKRDDELGAPAGGFADDDPPVVGSHHAVDDRKAEARSGLAALAPALLSPEALEQALAALGRDPGSVVADRQGDLPGGAVDEHLDGDPAGVCTSALPSRFVSTWRSCPASPETTAGPSARSSISRSGARALAS